jgi:hypothetical protein
VPTQGCRANDDDEIYVEVIVWINLAEDMGRWRARMNTDEPSGCIKAGDIFTIVMGRTASL